MSNNVFDLKVGYSCNNHCIHCVIEPNKQALIKNKTPIDYKYNEIIETMNSQLFKDADTIVLTGGEITIRRDFFRIVKYIADNYPQKTIAIQTNARKLKKYIKPIKEITNNVAYVIAIHSMNEELHNKIVGNKKELVSPFVETIDTIKEIKKVYGEFSKNNRIELVLSKYNMHDLKNTLIGLKKLGVKHIGISYPHLDGFFHDEGAQKVKEIGFSYLDLIKEMPEIIEFIKKNPDILMSFEEFPDCVWRDKNNILNLDLKNVIHMGREKSNTSVQFPGEEVTDNFQSTWYKMHKYPKSCENCYMKKTKQCFGIWEEANIVWGGQGLQPIEKEELNKK